MSIYFDNAATTVTSQKAAQSALEAMQTYYANPSSAHSFGLEAEHILKESRKSVLEAMGYSSSDGNLIFTSCGTEGNNMAIFGTYSTLGKRKNNVVISDSEHPSVEMCAKELEKCGVEVRRIPTKNGKLDLEYAKGAIDGKTMLVSCMTVNNETGAVYDIKSLGKLCRQNAPDAYLHTDAVQGFCKLPYSLASLDCDLVTVSAHKIHAPKGTGALFVKKGVRIPTRMFGGGQEGTLRSGTENVSGISAFAAACREYIDEKNERLKKIKELNEELRKNLAEFCPYVLINSHEDFAPHILSIAVLGIRSEIMLRFLSEKGIFVSAGSACSSKSSNNRVLDNFGLDAKRADSTLRISFSRYNTLQETKVLALAINEGYERLAHTL